MTRATSGWERFAAAYSPGDVVAVTVTRTMPFGCLMEAADGAPGLLQTAGTPRVGERVEGRIEALDADRRRISLTGV